MPGLNATRLARLQNRTQQYMPDTCTIERNQPISDNQGGYSPNFGNIATVACRLRPAGGDALQIPVADELAAMTRWMLSVPVGTDIRPSDQVQVQNLTLKVIAPFTPKSWEIQRQVLLVEISRQ